MITLSFTTVAAAAIRRQTAKKSKANVARTLRRGVASLVLVLVAAGVAHAGGVKSFSRSSGGFSKGNGGSGNQGSMKFNVQKFQNSQSLKSLSNKNSNSAFKQKISNSILNKGIVATKQSDSPKVKFDKKFDHVVKTLKPTIVHHQGGIKNKILVDTKFGQGKHFDKNCGKKFDKHCDWNWCWKNNCKYSCYKPSQAWHCWDYPAWCGLYRHKCGYWYDVPPVVIQQGVDLQLLAIRFVDGGNPTENLGPRFRVWVRNNSPVLINTPFNVLLMAAQDAVPSANLPQSGMRVESIAPGQVLPVDVRLPMEAGHPSLGMMHVLIDGHREIMEVHENNNGTVVPRAEIPLVDPALLATDSPVAPVGGEINIAGEGIGQVPGRAIVKLGGLDMEAEVIGWSDMGLRIRLPALPLANPTDAQVVAIRADGAAARPLALKVVPIQAAMAAPVAPPSGPDAGFNAGQVAQPMAAPMTAPTSVPLMLQGVVGQNGQPLAGSISQ